MSKQWTAAEVPDQSGRTAIITGGNSGIGYFAALELARKGANVVLACRSVDKGKQAARDIEKAVPKAQVSVEPLDLASQGSIHSLAAQWLGDARPLDLLINNAGVMALPKRTETQDGFEMQFGTNVLGHFALTGLLLPSLTATSQTATKAPRIVTLASIAHLRGRIELDNLQSEKKYEPMETYSQSKLGDLMFALELDRRLQACGSRVESIAAHPGVAPTQLFLRDAPAWQRPMRRVVGVFMGIALNTAEKGALPTLYAATSAEAKPGGYYGPTGLMEARGPVGVAKVSDRAQNRTIAAQLWERCEELTGVRFP
jgi:NAD(P)-dependent dehydrogenase (short-subunit alcohol dehydrogenase family)